jgi:hypothetical protein
MQSQPADRHPPRLHTPSVPQCPVQQPAQFVPQVQVAGQTTPSPLHIPPKHSPGGTQVPWPPGRLGSLAQQARPGIQESSTPVRQRQPRSKQVACAAVRSGLRPTAATAPRAACIARAITPRREVRAANPRTRSSNRLCSKMSPFYLHIPQRKLNASGTGTGVSAIAGATLGAVVTPVARVRAVAAGRAARRIAITRVRAHAGSPRHSRIGCTADQRGIAGMQCPARAAAPDIVAIESSPGPHWQACNDQRSRHRHNAAYQTAARLSCRQRTGHRIEPLAIHRRASLNCRLDVSHAGVQTISRDRRTGNSDFPSEAPTRR